MRRCIDVKAESAFVWKLRNFKITETTDKAVTLAAFSVKNVTFVMQNRNNLWPL